jgi:hypothetical protein
MVSPLDSKEVQFLYGTLLHLLYECPASQMRIIVADAGWDSGHIPDGLDETGQFARRPIIVSAIDGQWGQWDHLTKVEHLRHLAQALITFFEPKGMVDKVNAAILKNGFRFENGDFVPVDASGQIPQ